jgi:hypothetical protein
MAWRFVHRKGWPVMPETLDSWQDLRAAEKSVLDAVRAHRFGAQLFLVNPAKFLRESGFSVGELFVTELQDLPGVKVNPAGAYAAIAAGHHPMCKQSISIATLGLPPGLGGTGGKP